MQRITLTTLLIRKEQHQKNERNKIKKYCGRGIIVDSVNHTADNNLNVPVNIKTLEGTIKIKSLTIQVKK